MATWTPLTKGTPPADKQLLIEGSYQLLIGEGYFLDIDVPSTDFTWTSATKPSAATFTSASKQADATFTNLTKN